MEPGAAGRSPARGLSRRGMGPAARSAQKCRTGAEAINAQLWMMVNFKRFALRCQVIYSGAFHKICRHVSVESSRAGPRNAPVEAGDRPEAAEGLAGGGGGSVPHYARIARGTRGHGREPAQGVASLL